MRHGKYGNIIKYFDLYKKNMEKELISETFFRFQLQPCSNLWAKHFRI